jgi:hypothetical protein
VTTDRKSLLALQKGDRLSKAELALLCRKGLIDVDEVKNNDLPAGQREYIFTSFTKRGKRMLEG